MPRAPRILVACTGSVASIKLPVLLTALRSAVPAAPLRVIATTPALHFFARHEIEASGVQVFTDADEWSAWSKLSDPVLHIQLRNWADLIVIAPLDANTLAKLANGLCDNLLVRSFLPYSDIYPLHLTLAR